MTSLSTRRALAGAGLLCAATASAMQAQADRSKPPELGPPPALHLPPLQRLQLSNGLPVLFMAKHTVPLVQVNLVLRVGSVMDPADKPGLASFTAAMLDEGAGGRSALDLAAAIDYLGANLSVSSGYHATTVSLHTPLAQLDSALRLLADVAQRPAFAAEELARQRLQRLTTLLQWRDNPGSIADVIYDRSVFGPAHPYGRPTIGTAQSLGAFTPDDLKAFHQLWYRPNNAGLIVVGDVSDADLMPKLEAAFGHWPAAVVPQARVPEARQVSRREIVLVDKPEAAQSEIRIGRIGVARSTEDYYALVVMNTIVGGSFGSRLNQTLREEKQYTYGARSGFTMLMQPGPFTAQAAVQTPSTDSALVYFVRGLESIRQPVPDDELQRAKNYVALRFPGRFQTVDGIAAQVGDAFVYNLPPDYFNTYVQRILAVTKDDVLRVARKYIDATKVEIIVVGDRAKIGASVQALKLGPVRMLTVEDVLGPPPTMPATP